MSIWERKQLNFNSFEHIKNYLYLSIKNKFKTYITHRKSVDKFTNYLSTNEEYYISYIIESETISMINDVIDTLPSECAKVLNLFIQGWEIKEIADKLNKSQSTIYNQKNEAISILKKKLPLEKFLLVINLLS